MKKKKTWTQEDLKSIFNKNAQEAQRVCGLFPGFCLMEYEIKIDSDTGKPVWVFTVDDLTNPKKLKHIPKKIDGFRVKIDYKWAG